jgi:hypothetical protein
VFHFFLQRKGQSFIIRYGRHFLRYLSKLYILEIQVSERPYYQKMVISMNWIPFLTLIFLQVPVLSRIGLVECLDLDL